MDARRLPSWIAVEWQSPAISVRRMEPSRSSAATSSSSPRSPARSRRRVAPMKPKSPQDQRHHHSSLILVNEIPTVPVGDQQPGREDHVPSCTASEGNTEASTISDIVVLVPGASLREQAIPKTEPSLQVLNTILTPELEWERKYLLQTLQEGTDAVDLRIVMERIREFPQVLQPVHLNRDDTQGLVSGQQRLLAPNDNDASSNSRDQFSRLHQETRKRRAIRIREELLREEASQIAAATHADPSELYEQTILGTLSSLDMTMARDDDDDDASDVQKCTILDLIRAVMDLRPDQVRCSQRIPGHTPLRDAVSNATCLPAVLEMLVETDPDSINIRDQDGLTPLDHLLHAVQLGPYQETSVARVEGLLQHAHPHPLTSSDTKSPLLYLLSLGTSFGVLPGAAAVVPLIPEAGIESGDPLRLRRILDCVRLLLRWNPALMHSSSPVTGCSPLHVAIRNYGNFAPLVRELIDRDANGSASLMRHRNRFGDMVLHVACSVGVPMDMMRLVLARTLMVTGGTSTADPHSLVWSTNASGYTPVDLEWIRHIEAGNGFFSHRSFYPLDARGIRRPGGRCDALYDGLLRQAVDQVLNQPSGSMDLSEGTTADVLSSNLPVSDPSALVPGMSDSTVGLLLHRILLVVRASFGDSFSRSPFDLSGDILHQAAALCGPHGPVLPRPVLELILWQHPEQIGRGDHAGKLPLHYAVQLRRTHEEASAKSVVEWKLWVNKLLRQGPDACRVRDNRGRLPLQHALDYPSSEASATTTLQVQEARNAVVRDLASTFPMSVELVDPVAKLYPFQLAALNPLISIDTVYLLLRMCPGVIAQSSLGRNA